jgi:hypothetical protein
MTTHVATATIADSVQCSCPPGMVCGYRKKKHKPVKVGKGTCVVFWNNGYSPDLIIPNYKWDDKNRKGPITLVNFLEDQQILLPVAMIKAHVKSAAIQATPIAVHDDNIGRSKPASGNKLIDNQDAEGQFNWDHSSSTNIDDNIVEEFIDEDCLIDKDETTEAVTEEYDENENRDEWIDSMDRHLTTSDIDHLRIVLNNTETALFS